MPAQHRLLPPASHFERRSAGTLVLPLQERPELYA